MSISSTFLFVFCPFQPLEKKINHIELFILYIYTMQSVLFDLYAVDSCSLSSIIFRRSG